MTIRYYLPLIVLLAGCTAKDSREGTHTADGNYVIFSDPTSGWTARYPKSWPLLSAAEIRAMEGIGQEALENALDAEVDVAHRNLLWLKKDDFNSMTSNYQRHKPETDGPYEETEKLVPEVLETTYRQNNLQFDTERGKTNLDGLEFSTWQAVIYVPDSKDTLMTQIMYMRLIDNQVVLTLNINYNNAADRDTLLAVINSGKFTKRD